MPSATFEVLDIIVSGGPWNTSIATAVAVHGTLADGSSYDNVFNQFMHMKWGRVTEIRTLENTEVLLLGVSRTTVESWRQAGVLVSAHVTRRRHEVTTDSLVRLQVLLEELRRLGKSRELRDYMWWSGQDAADCADGKLAEALRQLRAGELGEEYVPSAEDLDWARRELADPGAGERS